jgi:uncharacterized repeat protein (TIGR03803 family)
MKKLKIWAWGLLAVCLVVPWAQGAQKAPLSGITMTQLVAFDNTNNGGAPYSSPVLGPDGNLYGTAAFGNTDGGTNDNGLIYRVSNILATNAIFTALHVFSNWDGSVISSPMTFGQDGNLYGVAEAGGSNNLGTIFEIATNGSFSLLYTFGSTTNSLGYSVDGANPNSGLVQGRDGLFYGTTYYGGSSNLGTVFQFSTNGTLNTLHSFTGNDGASPYQAPLVEGADGVFYGTTYAGGTNSDGTIFEITSAGALTTLVQFNGTNGANVYNGLSFGADGNLYGTTYAGGTNGTGTIFRVTTNGNLTT